MLLILDVLVMCEGRTIHLCAKSDKSIWMHGGGLTALVTDLNTMWLNVIIIIIIIVIIIMITIIIY